MARFALLCLCLMQRSVFVLGQRHSGPVTVHPSITAAAVAAAQTSAITGCHTHGPQTFCLDGSGGEVLVSGTATATGPPPPQFTDCHSHGPQKYCVGPNGDEVQVLSGESSGDGHGHEEHGHEEHDHGKNGHEGLNCHFHAGVEHCIPENGSEAPPMSCDRVDRDYNIPYRIGSLFAILVTSAIAVFGPVLMQRFFASTMNIFVFTIIKQLGTGIMIATAFIHLLTHAELMFGNQCLGTLQYEATATSIFMAGLFITFLIEYFGNRIALSRGKKYPQGNDIEPSATSSHTGPVSGTKTGLDSAIANLGHSHGHLGFPDDKISVFLMEAGIVFHSVILGVTLVVSGDSGYTPLFIVIIFHQMFEGLALGSRIADLANTNISTKLVMSSIFALITPLGMAIGLGVLHSFNGNDKSTIVAIGTLDAFSAGILAWAAIVDMWTHDWLHGDLKDASIGRMMTGLLALITGMVLMGVLGKWA
ncbi:Zinc-regulated transporter [Trichophyton interdigitale]|uniref:Zinc-regulated transporter n=1 Tax=Trichophyton interdigitale TaxID=101480 RepID=A0A9P4YEJ7_9EURO|nr:Zinc-regulated transporter [Trichophyton interdigitale]KAF3896389.1 Zinc-regulated transporter [Trichophyton interdigitale]KAG8210432.1 Zinc-regulated transporter [Trichophyton interdigitale]